MSDNEEVPSVDSALESIINKALPQLAELVDNDGEVTRSFRCKGCATSNSVQFRVGNMKDLGTLVGTLTAARARLKEKDDPTSAKALKYQVDLGELSSAELAERIVILEEQLAGVSEQEGI